MALPSTSLSWSSETLEIGRLKGILPTVVVRPSLSYFHGRSAPTQYTKIRCCSSLEMKGDVASVSGDEELGHVMRFKMSDFKLLNSVSIGLSGRVSGFLRFFVLFSKILICGNVLKHSCSRMKLFSKL